MPTFPLFGSRLVVNAESLFSAIISLFIFIISCWWNRCCDWSCKNTACWETHILTYVPYKAAEFTSFFYAQTRASTLIITISIVCCSIHDDNSRCRLFLFNLTLLFPAFSSLCRFQDYYGIIATSCHEENKELFFGGCLFDRDVKLTVLIIALWTIYKTDRMTSFSNSLNLAPDSRLIH